MTRRSATYLAFFALLLASPYVVEPAYIGFLFAFSALAVCRVAWDGVKLNSGFRLSPFLGFVLLSALIAACVVVSSRPPLRDLVRDIGALTALLVGIRFFRGGRHDPLPRDALLGLSLMGVLVSLVTIGAAFLALTAGVSAYVWRGEYVPWGHTWIPFAIAANAGLASLDGQRASVYHRRIVLCVLATFASLSRTDLLLEAGLLMLLAYRHREKILKRASGFLVAGSAILATVVLTVAMLSLPAVQQRVEAGVGSNDQSLGWRFMEHVALYDHFAQGTWVNLLVGFGLGARMPLPEGVLDFNGNPSIPQLHDSFGTIALKVGLLGVATLAWFLLRRYRTSRRLDDMPAQEYRQAGRWIVLLILGKALTLQGLTEWSQLVFFGIGCMLMVVSPVAVMKIQGVRRVTAQDETFARCT